MSIRITLSALAMLAVVSTHAQGKKTNPANADFRRKIMALKEYKDEQYRIQKLNRLNHTTTTVAVSVDNTTTGDEDADDDNSKAADIITGYIQDVDGDEKTVAYELQYDPKTKSIIGVKKEIEDTDAVKETKDKESKDDDK